jgi:signal transduction histidine kinase
MVVSILLLSIFLTGTTMAYIINNFFESYLIEEYEDTVEMIMEDAEDLLAGNISESEFYNEFQDPIISITIVSTDEEILYYLESPTFEDTSQRDRGRRNNGSWFNEGETDRYNIESDGEMIGSLYVERSVAIQDSETRLWFTTVLLRSLMFAGLIALVFSALLSRIMSKGITTDLKDTAEYANAIESAEEIIPKASKIIEIKNIQDRLENLSIKLKIQDNIRKEKVDHIAHETRTPITILKSQMEGALDGVLEMDKKRIKTCLEATNKLQNLTKEITSVLEVEEEEIVPKLESYDLIEEVKMIQTGLLLQYQEKGLSLEIDGPDKLVIMADKSLLSVSLYNLLINALKFTKQGGVRIVISENPTRIEIIDTGIGISEEKQAKIFEPYYRAVTKEEYPGDGLGLYITKKNIDALGGELTVSSKLASGTSFKITL